MPFPNEHAARQTDPGQYETFRRTHPKGFPAGIDVIFGIRNVGGRRVTEIQSIRFARDKWTPDKAKAWLKDHGFKTTIEEAAVKEDTTKAMWDTAFVNGLPDAAFAVILPGGRKDDEGKTVPRSLRKLPHHNANVKSPAENTSVDLPHLRNALARAPQSDLSDAAKREAIAHLERHAKELLASHGAKPAGKKVEKSFWAGVLWD